MKTLEEKVVSLDLAKKLKKKDWRGCEFWWVEDEETASCEFKIVSILYSKFYLEDKIDRSPRPAPV